MKRYALLISLMCMLCTAQAQFSFEGGLNASTLRIKANDSKVPTKYLLGATFGMMGGIPLSDARHVFLELGAMYQTNGAKINTKPDWEYLLSGITFPINIEYKSGDKCSKRFFAGAGPYIRANLSGTAYTFDRNGTLKTEYTDLVIGTDIKRIDMGMGLNLGYLGKKHWYIRANYAYGFKNNLVRGNEKNYLKQSTGGLTVGYLFRGCRKIRYFVGGRARNTNHWRGVKKLHWSRHERLYRYKGPGTY